MDNEAKLMGIKLYRICKLDYLYLLYQVYVLHIEYIGVYGKMEPIKKLFFSSFYLVEIGVNKRFTKELHENTDIYIKNLSQPYNALSVLIPVDFIA